MAEQAGLSGSLGCGRCLGAASPNPTKQTYYLVFAPKGISLQELAGAAGPRWTIEECFERAKSDRGLDHCEARSWHGCGASALWAGASRFFRQIDRDHAGLGKDEAVM